ncbi:hypothetical protein [Halobaculum marinum]|uniref:BZIP transcription factor n=1 Tax=Halobaculum marinum TaxID=3031996 RepID=A0ABD5WVQ9_9EURY|nr:hypothetical protein [Halobaculum sp. DT55]
MGDERADRGSGSDGDDARDGSDETAREATVTRLKRENERLRERLDERRSEREQLVDHYETLLDAARRRDGDDSESEASSPIQRLFDRL